LADRRWRGKVLALFGAACALGGCAPNQGLFDALQSKYQGYEELSPKLSPGKTGHAFPYTPGTILPALAFEGAQGERTWVATTDIRCGPDVELAALPAWRRRAYHYHHGQSLASGASARTWLDRHTGFGTGALAGISEVVIDVSSVRSYEPSVKYLRQLNASADTGCVLLSTSMDGIARRVRGVIVGNIRVRLYFEQGIDLLARAQLSDQLSLALGFGFERISESEIEGRDIAFGVKWQ